MPSPPAEQFAEWARGLRTSDEAAFTHLYHATYDALHRYVWYLTRDLAATADVLQEVYVKLWQVRATLDPEKSLRALLYQMTRNFALNHLRHRKRHRHDALDDATDQLADPAAGADVLDAQALRLTLQRAIDGLPERRREAFCLSRFDGLSHDEIAQVMHLAPKTVNNHIVLALQTLRHHVHTHHPDAAL